MLPSELALAAAPAAVALFRSFLRLHDWSPELGDILVIGSATVLLLLSGCRLPHDFGGNSSPSANATAYAAANSSSNSSSDTTHDASTSAYPSYRSPSYPRPFQLRGWSTR